MTMLNVGRWTKPASVILRLLSALFSSMWSMFILSPRYIPYAQAQGELLFINDESHGQVLLPNFLILVVCCAAFVVMSMYIPSLSTAKWNTLK